MQAKVNIDKENWIAEEEGEREEGNTQQHVANSPRIAEALGDSPIGGHFICLDRLFEDGLGQHIQESAAEKRHEQPRCDLAAAQGIHDCPHEVHDDADVRQLNSQPNVRPAGQSLKLPAGSFDEIQEE